ncbi:hypothetical protein EKA99_11550, partial [Streptococcus pseudopneumoniae]|nr:hypothetical protein [Streptococcus pseudopneumoniae]
HLKAAEAGEFVTIDALFQAYTKELGSSYTRDAFLFPHLFNGVHLWCVWRNKGKANISRNL